MLRLLQQMGAICIYNWARVEVMGGGVVTGLTMDREMSPVVLQKVPSEGSYSLGPSPG